MRFTTLEQATSWLKGNAEMVERRAWAEHDEIARCIVELHTLLVDDPPRIDLTPHLLDEIHKYRLAHGDLAKMNAKRTYDAEAIF